MAQGARLRFGLGCPSVTNSAKPGGNAPPTFCPAKAGDPGRHAADNRLFVHGVLWILRSGARWSDLPPRYGPYKSVHKRFCRWAHKGAWEKVFTSLIKDPGNDYVMLDASLVKAHQQAATGKKGATKTRLRGVPEEG